MSLLRNIADGLRSLFRKERVDRELDEELHSFVEMAAEEKMKQGLSREQAARAVRLERGTLDSAKETVRASGWESLVETFWEDVQFAARVLRKNPGFTTVAVLTLALGIGANTAIFSLLNAVMLQSIPVRNPQQLVVPRWSAHHHPQNIGMNSFGDCKWTNGSNSSAVGCSFSYAIFRQIRDQARIFSSIAAFAGPAQLDLSGNGTASMVSGEIVSGDFFQTLSVPAAIGRTLEPADEKPGAEAVAVLDYGYWQSAFGGSSNVIGKSIKLNGVPCTIVGVADARFARLTPGKMQDLWLPLSQVAALRIPWSGAPKNNAWYLAMVGRVAPGISLVHAQSALTALFRNQVTQDSILKPSDDPQVALLPAEKALVGMRAYLAEPLFVLVAVAGILLLISCANIAGLTLSRAAARQKEIAVRLALGAGRGRVVRQLLTESVMLSFVGAALGGLIAFWGANALAAFVATNSFSPLLNVNPDLAVLGFTVAITALTGVLFGLAPALRGTRVNVAPVLKDNAANFSGTGFGLRRKLGLANLLVIAQVALSVIVLASTGLVIRSLANLARIDPGFDTHNILQFSVNPALTGSYNDSQIQALYGELQTRLRALPGVTSVTYSSGPLLDGGLWTQDIRVQGQTDRSTVETQMLGTGPDFFATMRIPLTSGRVLNPADLQSRHDVAVVNKVFVREFLPNREPLGLHFGGNNPNDTQYEIVGVVADTKYDDLRKEAKPTAFIPMKSGYGRAHFSLKTASNPQALLPAVRRVLSGVDNDVPLFDVRTQTERIERLLFNERLIARLGSLFGMLALALACIGLYGLLAYEVTHRTREIGIRTAMGAQQRDVVRLIAVQGLLLIAIGASSGILAALGVTRGLRSLLYAVQPADPITLVSVCALLALVGLAACLIPARRATRVDPMVALRYE